jgi:hypothetical protein
MQLNLCNVCVLSCKCKQLQMVLCYDVYASDIIGVHEYHIYIYIAEAPSVDQETQQWYCITRTPDNHM